MKLWNPLTGELIQSLKNHSANFTAIVLDGNCKGLGMIGSGEPFKVFDVGHETRTIKGYSTGIKTQAHSPDGQFTARSTPDLDGQIELIRRQTGKRIYLLPGHIAAVQSLSFSPDSQVLVSRSAKDFKMWRVQKKKETYDKIQKKKEMYGRVRKKEEKYSCLQSARTFYPTVAFTQLDDNSNPVLISSDFWGEFEYSYFTLSEKTTEKWRPRGGRGSSGAAYVTLSADRKVLARRYGKQPVQLWNLHTGEEFGFINLDADYYRLALSSTGDILAAEDGDKITLWDVKAKTIIANFTHNLHWVGQIVFSPDDRILACGSHDRKIKLWNLQTNCEIKTLQGFSSIEALAFSPVEPILASGSDGGTIKFWNLETLEEIHSFSTRQSKINNLKFSPNGNFVASSDETTIRLWKLKRSS